MYWSRFVSVDRKAKKKKQEERDRRQRAKWVEIYDRIVPLVGAKDLFQRLPETAREQIRRLRFPGPEVCFGDDFNRADEHENVREAVAQVLDQFAFKTSDGHTILAGDCFRVVFSLRAAFDQLRVESPDGSLSLLVRQTRKKLGAVVDELVNEQLILLFLDIDMALAEFTRIDTAIYWYQLNYERIGPGRPLFRITLHKSPPDRIVLLHHGESRRAFRCGASFGPVGVQWVEVPASLFGITESGNYPVYVQSHAINKLHERVPISDGSFVHDAMWQSLRSPKVTRNHKGEYLIEYWFFEYKLGYFVAEVVEQSILVTTFLFLTMQGTPEAISLFDHLRLRRPDIEQLGLDSLGNYLFTDLQKDSELAGIFDRCGCGHLLKMLRSETQPDWKSGYARDVRKYLGMKLT
jgi:hypothetical protein